MSPRVPGPPPGRTRGTSHLTAFTRCGAIRRFASLGMLPLACVAPSVDWSASFLIPQVERTAGAGVANPLIHIYAPKDPVSVVGSARGRIATVVRHLRSWSEDSDAGARQSIGGLADGGRKGA